MNLFTIVFKNMQQRALATALTVVSISLGVALACAILIVRDGAEENFTRYSRGWDVMVGYRGSPLEIVLNTMFNLANATNTIPFRVYERLLDDPEVSAAIPFCTGVSYEAQFAVIATKKEFYERFEVLPGHYEEIDGKRTYVPGEPLHLARGRWFDEEKRGEAVIGAYVESHSPLKLDSQFYAAPGYVEDEYIRKFSKYYGSPLTVVGVLEPTGTPADKSIYVAMKTWFRLPGMVIMPKGTDEESVRRAQQRARLRVAELQDELRRKEREEALLALKLLTLDWKDLEPKKQPGQEPQDEKKEEEEIEEEFVDPDFVGPVKPVPVYYQLTAVGVRLKDPDKAGGFIEKFNRTSKLAQAISPVKVVRSFFKETLRWISEAFLMIACMVIIASALSIMVWIYNSMNERRKGIAVMRGLGANRKTIFRTIMLESAMLCGIGALVGIPLGHLAVQFASDYIYRQSGAVIHAWSFNLYEILLVVGTIVLGALVGILPGIKAYRTDVAASLTPFA